MSALENIVVVGVSLAGLRTIEALRREGYEGAIVALGEEPHLPYDRPPLSKQFLTGEWDQEKISLRKQGFDDLGITWRRGERAQALDAGAKEIVLESGERLGYGGLVIATGSVAKRLPFGRDLAGIHVLRSLGDAVALRDELGRSPRVLVVGAGFIGMEAAATCREMGLEVSVVEPLEAPLLRGLGPVLGPYVGEKHRSKGVELRCGVGVEGFEGQGRVERVRLAGGDSIDADVVIVGIGVAPAIGWLEGSGLELDDGIVCDGAGGTKLPDIVAVGDAARWHNPLARGPVRYEHWTSAVEQADFVAARLLRGPDVPALSQVPYVWTDQFELRLAVAGRISPGAEMHVCKGSLEEERCLVLFGREGRLEGAAGLRRPRPLLGARKRIGEGISFEEAIAENADG
ncbi:MAG: FAD-dependent oxidoreductase [Deltaproteobacteria bacterium]|nr:FAD-dependent oxidoreductase [Deltaproteobacteria bacterium]MBW2419554.1 FAD-dependent oxidoreductase [Deltaproteobacteria bacterium]